MDENNRRPQWMTNLVLPIVVAVLGALLIAVLTPAGDVVREVFFPTHATVSGTVEMDGKAVAEAHLVLDDEDAADTEGAGRFQLEDVGNGEHRLRVEALGAQPRDYEFSVDRGESRMELGAIEVQPYVRLGYFASVQLPGASGRPTESSAVKYDITLWIRGGDGALDRIQSVSYTMPPPLPAKPVRGAGADKAFCYRQSGSVPFEKLMVAGGAFDTAKATVDMADGRPFEISAKPGPDQPVACAAGQTPKDPPAPLNPRRPPSGPGTTSVRVADVGGLPEEQARRVLEDLGFKVGTDEEPGTAKVGHVIRTEPAAGAKLRKGSPVTLIVSNQHLVVVPNVVGDDPHLAKEKLTRLGFRVDGHEGSPATSPEEAGKVTAQSLEAGSAQPEGAWITLTWAGEFVKPAGSGGAA